MTVKKTVRKKIAFIKPGNYNKVGGGERVLCQIASYLAEDYDITLISYNSTESFYEIDKKVKKLTLGLNKSPFYFFRLFQPLFYLKTLNKVVAKNEIGTIIGFSDIGAIFIFLSFLFNTKIRKIAWIHNSYYQPINRIIKGIRMFVYSNFDNIIVLNRMDESIYKKKLGGDSVFRIPNPLSFKLTTCSDLQSKKILTIGRFHKEKGFNYLIEIAKIVFNKHPDWTLYIIGQDRGEEEVIRAMIEKNELHDKVFLKPPVQNIQEVYLDSSIYVMTSLYEAFGLVLTEASEAGLPLIAFNSPSGISDIIVNNRNGYLVDRFNIEDFAEKLLHLMNSYELRQQFGKEAKQMNSKFSIDAIGAKWNKLLIC